MENIWTIEEAAVGLCGFNLVGTVKTSMDIDMGKVEDAEMSVSERRALLRRVTDKILRLADADPASFLSENGSQLNKLIDLAAKQDEKEEQPSTPLEPSWWDANPTLTPEESSNAVFMLVDHFCPAEQLDHLRSLMDKDPAAIDAWIETQRAKGFISLQALATMDSSELATLIYEARH